MDRSRGNTIVITGAARGIGFATAAAVLDRGARVVIGDRDPAALAAAVTALAARGPVTGHDLDVTDRASFERFLTAARSDGGGRIDVLVNNAGVMPVGPFLDQSAETVRGMIEVNFGGVVNGCALVLPEMAARGDGAIVNIASLAGVIALPGQAVYAGTKFAVLGLSTALSDEFAPQGVSVSAVLPTFTATELIAGTTPSRAQRPVAPEQVAAAVVGVLDRPRTQVAVPGSTRVPAVLSTLLPDRARRWLNRRLGNDRVFLDVDAAARRGYEDRARHTLGVIDRQG